MQTYTIVLKDKIEVADQTTAFIFEKPAGFEFEAGQYVVMTLPNLTYPDERRGIRSLSIASAPYEDTLMFAMRVTSSGFKQTLKDMSIGETVAITQPFGHFVLPKDNNATPIVFLIGGIGITPARSILRQSVHTKSHRIFQLFYSNRAPKDVAFSLEIQSIPELPGYRCIDTMTDFEGECEWRDETGFICKEMLEKYPPATEVLPKYYVVGGPRFIQAMEDMLQIMNVASDRIVKDPFTGI